MKSLLTLIATTFAIASLTLGCGSKPATDGGDKAATGDKAAALTAETDQEKAWLAWKDDACKCSDLACASGAADKRLALEKKYPDSMSPKHKNIANIVRAANACLAKATGQ